ncbi:cell division protein FtsW [Anaerosphaera aminiphila DSM 21120]|uniref:Probable peptidoglycan glycosyltransferase FtsW n=1 Tax=Anaerosphaera aminiphila DSM 21120 TaxID=1120995 RepID=A0A1M5SYN2_9FIRM|nr:putative peptidoglycan glycosyltransferase FtsW [Anaerosphaera aminiphila]SHH43594.1 cell division protein FtsW [Anaerosphaera aminiphila DSM 21120]
MKLNYRQKLKELDLPLMVVTLLLLAFGLIAVTSAAYPEGIKYYDDGFYYAKRHLIFMVLGFIAMYIVYRIPRNFLKKLSFPLFAITIVLVALLWSPLGVERYGQVRWIQFPIINQLQPSDFVKISAVLYLAKILEANRKNIGKTSSFIAILAVIGIAVFPILLKDYSTALVIGASLGAMYLVGGMKPHQFVTIAGLGAVVLGVMVFGVDYRRERVMAYFTGSGQLGDNYQITQALYAIAMGRINGVGLFQSRQKYGNVPFAYNDFIFPIICEEFGLIGAIFLILLFVVLIYRGYVIANKATNYFDKYVAVGLTTYLGVQTVFNLGVSTKLFPVTGITLPFISSGGTALLVAMVSVGILLRISKDV